MLMMERYISIYRNLLAKSILTIDYSYPPSPSEPLSLPLPELEPPEGVCEPEVEPPLPLSPAAGALAEPESSGSFTDAETEAKEVLALGSTTTAPSTTLYIPFAIIIPRRVE